MQGIGRAQHGMAVDAFNADIHAVQAAQDVMHMHFIARHKITELCLVGADPEI